MVSGRDYEFANDLIRDVLYASTPEPTRLAYHRRAADLLTGQPESLARHAAAAGDWLRAGRAWLRAGEDAMGRYAASDAARWPRRRSRRPSGRPTWRCPPARWSCAAAPITPWAPMPPRWLT